MAIMLLVGGDRDGERIQSEYNHNDSGRVLTVRKKTHHSVFSMAGGCLDTGQNELFEQYRVFPLFCGTRRHAVLVSAKVDDSDVIQMLIDGYRKLPREGANDRSQGA